MKPPVPCNSRRGRSLPALIGVILALLWRSTIAVQAQPLGLLWEVYSGIGGVSLGDLTNHVRFPAQPDMTGFVLDFEAPVDFLDNYGQRLRGYVIPPVSGAYTFWISSDDASGLFLSTDDTPANRRLIASVTSWTSSREWGKEPNQKSVPIFLEADRPYYVEALMKEGGGGDNLAVRWQLPSGVFEEPIPRGRLLPFGATFAAPQVDVEPVDTVGVEGGSASFAVKLKGVSPARFQWYRNTTLISGETNSSYTRTPLSLDDHLSTYRCVITNTLGSVSTRFATLSVTPDTTAPALLSGINLSTTSIRLVFSEPMHRATATSTASYAISPTTTVTSAVLGADQRTLTLTCGPMVIGQEYVVSVLNGFDVARTPNVIASGTEVRFTAVEYVLGSVGESRPGVSVTRDRGFDLGGYGAGVGGGSDAFQFGYQTRTGDFDIQVRVESFSPSDPWAQAGLMARETLDVGSRFVAVFASPGHVGNYFITRLTAGDSTISTGSFPPNYPQNWLRLKRSGNAFTGYAGIDGVRWSILGSAVINLPSTVYFGPAVASRSDASSAMVRFRDIGATVSVVASGFGPDREPLGPSNRKTPLVVSEIMYHPAVRTDLRNLEFIEIYNAGHIVEDLTGYSIRGDIEYNFPPGTKVPAGGLLVIAKVPSDVRAVWGLADEVLGPYLGNLSNGGGNIRLRNELGTIVWSTQFSTRNPWPVAADGTGHSLVLSKPSYGEADARAWAASSRVGGSPGGMEAVYMNLLDGLVINEFLAHSEVLAEEFIELRNNSSASLDLSGCIVTDDPSTNRFVIPSGTTVASRSAIAFGRDQLGFGLKAGGETLILFNPDRSRVLDIVSFGGQAKGVATGRSPDGLGEFKPLLSPTPGQGNAAAGRPTIVINEILYNPLSRDPNDEFVELFNTTPNLVDLSGWRFVDGISYTFPVGSVIPGNGYLVVARRAAQLRLNHPSLSTTLVVGDFSGSLSGSGERIALARPEQVVSVDVLGVRSTNTTHVVVEEVTYGTGGRWGRWADGGGSSLERVDPRGGSNEASNWADSDETSKAGYSTIEFTGVMDNGRSEYGADLQMHLLGMGECLVDDVEVLSTGGNNLVSNGGFESGLTGWTISGTHRASVVELGKGVGGGRALHVIATGRGDTGANRIQTILANKTTLVPGSVVTLRAKVRWLAGHPEFLLRLRGNWMEATGRMVVPRNLGSPGTRNTRWTSNAGPAISGVGHAPVLPTAAQSVVVQARVSDPDGVGSVTLRYRQDPGGALMITAMLDEGQGGDAAAGDGIYSATIPGFGGGTLVAFQISAADAAFTGVTTRFPSVSSQECLIRWGETQPRGEFGVYRLWQTSANVDFLNTREPLANDPIDATFVYGNSRVIYNMTMRGKGSPFHGGSIGSDYLFGFQDDDLFLGESDVALVTVGNLGSDPSAQREQAAFWIGRQLGVPYLHRRHVHFYNNGNRQGFIYEDTQEPDGEFVGSMFPSGPDGDLHKIEDWFEFADDSRSFVNADATLQKFTTTGGAIKLARYRWDWRKRAVQDSANNYTNLFNLVNAVNDTSSSYTAQVENLVDVNEWMRTFALQHIVGNWDAYGHGRGKNSYLYKPNDGRWVVIPWDIDFVLGLQSDATNADIFGTNDPTIARMYSHPPFQRAFWRAMQDACDGPLKVASIGPLLDARHQSLQRNGVNAASPQDIKDWVDARRSYLLTRLAEVASSFAITSNGGQPFSTSVPILTLTGTAPVEVSALRVNGLELVPAWSTPTSWSLQVGLVSGANSFLIEGFNTRGEKLATASGSITVTYTGPSVDPAQFIVINEIHYNPLEPGAGFVELHNRSLTSALDLSGCELRGVSFRFPAGSLIQPGGFVVVAASLVDFATVYGLNVIPLGQFTGNLANGGETLRLVRPGATPLVDHVLDEVRYLDSGAWPTAADGQGPSLQLIDSAQDNSRPANWGAASPTSSSRTTPGAVNSIRATLAPFPSLWLNEIAPLGVASVQDSSGEAAPWLEIYNSGTGDVELGGLFLSDSVTNLTRWQLPSGVTIPSGAYRLLWLDGQNEQSTATEWHAPFRPSGLSAGGDIYLSRIQNGVTAVLDALHYGYVGIDRSRGSVPDGQPFNRQVLHVVTPGAPNDGTIPPVPVFVNEWMASNLGQVADPLDGRFDDWFELYNDATKVVDLSGYFLSDDPLDKTKFEIPSGLKIGAGGHLLVWADEESFQNTLGTDLHVNFKLSSLGETITLYAPDLSVVDAVAFGPQVANVSQGRSPDGYAGPLINLSSATPRAPNPSNTAAGWPTLDAVAPMAVGEGATIEFTLHGVSTETPQRPLSYRLIGAPAGVTIDNQTGLVRWVTGETDGPGTYDFQARVTDNAEPAKWASVRVQVVVGEMNTPPSFEPIADRSINEGEPFILTPVVLDPDLPRNPTRFNLGPDAPQGMRVDTTTGVIHWTPSEQQGGATYPVILAVADALTGGATAQVTFSLNVIKIENAPIFDPLPTLTVDEGRFVTIPVHATDPDLVHSQLIYSLENPAPAGMSMDSSTGTITWTPREQQGPGSYDIEVRATEPGVGGLTSLGRFSIIVRELNDAPTVSMLEYVELFEGDLLRLTARGTDTDAPVQRLTYRIASGAPNGMTIDSTTGLLTWQTDPVGGGSTNVVVVEVVDDGFPPLSNALTTTVVVKARERILISEFLLGTAVDPLQYVELHNTAISARDLSGVRVEPTGYVFPAGSTIPSGGFLVIGSDPTRFRERFGDEISLSGTFSSPLPIGSGTLRLVRPSNVGFPDEILDEIQYTDNGAWPRDELGVGSSLQLIDPAQDNGRPANWTMVTSSGSGLPVTALNLTDVWKFYQQSERPSATWVNSDFDDTTWTSGAGLFFVESAPLSAPKNTPLTLGAMTYYFRTSFVHPGSVADTLLRLGLMVDDGAVVYLNGQELYRVGMAPGAIDGLTPAVRLVGDAVLEPDVELAATSLVSGMNQLAVEVHQINSTSTDLVFGMQLQSITPKRDLATPGRTNSIDATLPALPEVRLGRLSRQGAPGVLDRAGDRDPWVELRNDGVAPAILDGLALAQRPDDPNPMVFPVGTVLLPGERRLVWCDAEVSETIDTELHAPFVPANAPQPVVLLRQQRGRWTVVDQSMDAPTELSIMVGQARGRKGQEVLVPCFAGQGFDQIERLGFTVRFDSAALEFRGLETRGVSGWTAATQASLGLVELAWVPGVGDSMQNLALGDRVVGLRFLIKTGTATTANVTIESPLTEAPARTAVNAVSIPLLLSSTGGRVLVDALDQARGMVRYYNGGTPVPGATIRMVPVSTGTSRTVPTDATGAFEFELEQEGSFRFGASGGPSETPANGVTTLDILTIRRHVIGLAAITSSYSLLAADVNGSSTISTLDITFIRRLILGLTSELPVGRWKHVPSSHVFPTPLSPWSYPSERDFHTGSGKLTDHDFVAIKVGDVNGSWTPQPPPPPSLEGEVFAASESGAGQSGGVELGLGSVVSLGANEIAVPLVVRGFESITSMQFGLRWDPRFFTFAGFSDLNLAGLGGENFGVSGIEQGRLRLSWDDLALRGVSVADGTRLMTLRFRSKSSKPAANTLAFSGEVLPLEVTRNLEVTRTTARSVLLWSGTTSPDAQRVGVDVRPKGIWLRFDSWLGLRGVIEATRELGDSAVWESLGTVEGTGEPVEWNVSNAEATQRYYRIRFEGVQ